MTDDELTDDELTDDELKGLRASPWAIKAGLLVEKDGEILLTAKGLAVIKAQMEEAGMIPIKI